MSWGAISNYWSFPMCLISLPARTSNLYFLSPKPMNAPGCIPTWNSHVHDSILWAPAVSKNCRESDTCVHFLLCARGGWLMAQAGSWEAARRDYKKRLAEIKHADRLQITNSTCVCMHRMLMWMWPYGRRPWLQTHICFVSNSHPIAAQNRVCPMGPSSQSSGYMGDKM